MRILPHFESAFSLRLAFLWLLDEHSDTHYCHEDAFALFFGCIGLVGKNICYIPLLLLYRLYTYNIDTDYQIRSHASFIQVPLQILCEFQAHRVSGVG
jgi:hypothetical protein